MGFVMKLVGLLLIIISIIAMLAFPEWDNPLSFISSPLFNLTKMFLTPISSFIFWVFIFLLGITFLEPKEGLLKKLGNK